MYSTEYLRRRGISAVARPRAPPGARMSAGKKEAGPMWGIDPAITKHIQVARRS